MTRRLILVLALVPVLALALPVRRLREMIAVAASGVAYPYSSDFYSDAYAWWVFATDIDPQPDVSPAGEKSMDYRRGDPVWSSDNGGVMVLDGNDALAWNYAGATAVPHTNGTVAAWVKVGSKASEDVVLSVGNNMKFDILRNSLGGTMRMNSPSPGVNLGGTTNLRDDEWHHLVWVARSSSYSFYVDGQNEGALTVYSGATNGVWFSEMGTFSSWIQGARYQVKSFTDYLVGSIGEVTIVAHKDLSDAEVLAWYNETKSAYGH